MPHKLDRKRHKRAVRARVHEIKHRYMQLTQNDSIDPKDALSVLKDADQVETVKNLARQLARRGVDVRFAAS